MSEQLLKEFVSSVLREKVEHFSVGSYAPAAQGDFTRTFLEPFKDVFDTGAAVLAGTANAHISMMKRLLSRVLYDIMPDVLAARIIPRVEVILRKEREYAEKIQQKYGETLETNSKELFRGDIAMFAFFAAPAKFLAAAALIKSPDSLGRLFRTLAGQREFRDKNVRGPIKTLVGQLRSLTSVREGALNERGQSREEVLRGLQELILSPEVAGALDAHFAEPREEVESMLQALRQDIKRDYTDIGNSEGPALVQDIQARLVQGYDQSSTGEPMPKVDIEGAAQHALKSVYVQALQHFTTREQDPAVKQVLQSLLKDLEV